MKTSFLAGTCAEPSEALMPFIGRRARNALEQASLRPKAVQRSLLASILEDNAGTVFGKEHGFQVLEMLKTIARVSQYVIMKTFAPTWNG